MDVKLSTLYTMMRAAVSGEKYRLRSGQYDLDLTYITDRGNSYDDRANNHQLNVHVIRSDCDGISC